MINKQREEDLYSNWSEETNEEWTQEWRNELTDEEQKLIDEWDRGYCADVKRICEEILKLNKDQKNVS